ncbi:hypothetical protein BC829DRAFT_163067 [Chytridium lagenaria]|nr:hypothetical protein BC829DRAFT_163067 [Chytridium lagenaria]
MLESVANVTLEQEIDSLGRFSRPATPAEHYTLDNIPHPTRPQTPASRPLNQISRRDITSTSSVFMLTSVKLGADDQLESRRSSVTRPKSAPTVRPVQPIQPPLPQTSVNIVNIETEVPPQRDGDDRFQRTCWGEVGVKRERRSRLGKGRRGVGLRLRLEG